MGESRGTGEMMVMVESNGRGGEDKPVEQQERRRRINRGARGEEKDKREGEQGRGGG